MAHEKEVGKREIIQIQIISKLKKVLLDFEDNGELDYFKIEITNHQGCINVKKTTTEKIKAY